MPPPTRRPARPSYWAARPYKPSATTPGGGGGGGGLGSIGNPHPGGTGVAPPPGEWKAADPNWVGPALMPGGPPGGDGGGGGGGGGGGFVDPGYTQFLANLRAMGALDASRRQELVQQALIRFGLVPGSLKDPYGDVTDVVRKAAEEKTTAGTSTYARIQDWNKQILSRLRKALAARGALRSGELGFGLERQDLGYRQTFDDATSQLLDYISGAQFAFAQSEMARAMQQGAYPFDPNAYGGGGGGGDTGGGGGGGIGTGDPFTGGVGGGLGTGIGLGPIGGGGAVGGIGGIGGITMPPFPQQPALPPGYINPGWY